MTGIEFIMVCFAVVALIIPVHCVYFWTQARKEKQARRLYYLRQGYCLATVNHRSPVKH